jgi:spectinomycin phosphotransferase
LLPPERDLWWLVEDDGVVATAYASHTGVAVDHEAIELYRLGWDIAEIDVYIGEFRQPHIDSEDTRVGFDGLVEHLDPARWTR